MINQREIVQKVFVFSLVIFSLNFFLAKFASTGPIKNISYAFVLFSILISLPYFYRRSGGFVLPVQLISASIVLSIAMAYIFWGQELSYASTTIPFLLWFFFFFLLQIEFPIKEIEKIIFFYGIVYIVLFTFQFLNSHTVYFGYLEEFKEDRGVKRILFPGGGIFFLAYFLSLTRVVRKKKFNWPFALFLLAGFIVTVLQVTKQAIFLLLFFSIFHFVRKLSPLMKLVVIASFLTLSLFALNSSNPISRGLSDSQKETSREGVENVRVLAAEYFITNFSPSLSTRIFGNGFPNSNSSYGRYIKELQELYGFHIADVGLIGMYVLFGIIPILAYGAIFYKSFTIRTPKKYYYLKYYLWFLLLTCLTSDAVYSISFMISNVFALYCYQVIYEREQDKLIESSDEI